MKNTKIVVYFPQNTKEIKHKYLDIHLELIIYMLNKKDTRD